MDTMFLLARVPARVLLLRQVSTLLDRKQHVPVPRRAVVRLPEFPHDAAHRR